MSDIAGAAWRAAETVRRGSPECGCPAFDTEQGWHVEADHKTDCRTGGDPPCGGCWGCQSAQQSHREWLDAVSAPGQEGRRSANGLLIPHPDVRAERATAEMPGQEG